MMVLDSPMHIVDLPPVMDDFAAPDTEQPENDSFIRLIWNTRCLILANRMQGFPRLFVITLTRSDSTPRWLIRGHSISDYWRWSLLARLRCRNLCQE